MVVSRHPVLEDHDTRGPNARESEKERKRGSETRTTTTTSQKRDVVEENERDEDNDAPFRDESAVVVRGERHFWMYSEERYFVGASKPLKKRL